MSYHIFPFHNLDGSDFINSFAYNEYLELPLHVLNDLKFTHYNFEESDPRNMYQNVTTISAKQYLQLNYQLIA